MEAKNKKLFSALEKSLADKARDYKDKTVDILQSSPMKHGHDAPHAMHKSPLIAKYAPRSSAGSQSMITSEQLYAGGSPVRRGRSHHVSPMQSSKTPEQNSPGEL